MTVSSWFLLLLTLGCGLATYDAFRWLGSIERAPFSSIADLWRGGLSHLSLQEKQDIKRRYASMLFGFGWIPWGLLAVTLVLGAFTLRSFLA